MYFKWHMHWYDSNLWTYHKEITNYDWKIMMLLRLPWSEFQKSDWSMQVKVNMLCILVFVIKTLLFDILINHRGKADDRNCNYGHPKMADVESGKNVFDD
jgi:hypothetical protein